ncbi:MAG TPA: hypothetical protein VJU16_06575 [Planctomycetota bacterium]|nr:hypothetical protein [Planctomycetota bacterium]
MNAPAHDAGVSPDIWLRAGLAGSFLFLYGSMAVVYFLFHRHLAAFDQLGMTELPWLTEFYVSLIRGFRSWWWAIGLICLGLGVLVLKGRLGRSSWKPIGATFLIAALLPVMGYVAMELPLAALHEKLNPGNH